MLNIIILNDINAIPTRNYKYFSHTKRHNSYNLLHKATRAKIHYHKYLYTILSTVLLYLRFCLINQVYCVFRSYGMCFIC